MIKAVSFKMEAAFLYTLPGSINIKTMKKFLLFISLISASLLQAQKLKFRQHTEHLLSLGLAARFTIL